MAFFTRPRLDNLQFQQQLSDNLVLSGSTTFYKTVGGLNLRDQSNNVIPVDASNPFNGSALVYSGGTIIFGQGGGGGAGFLNNVGGGSGIIFKTTSGGTSDLRTLSGGTGVRIETIGDVVVINSFGGLLGNPLPEEPTDVTYLDGLFPFTSGTSVGKAVDDINEFLGLLAPAQPPPLRDHFTSGTFSSGKLSFGASNNIVGYSDVVGGFNGSALDVNGIFSSGTDRKGLTQNSLLSNDKITGVLNDDVTDGDPSGIPYRNDAFRDGNTGDLKLILNGTVIDSIDLSATPSADTGGNLFLSVSQVYPVKFDNGNDFAALVYRTGTYDIPSSQFRNGYNYLRVIHSSSTFNRVTNYTNWVYDPDINDISFAPVNSGTDFQSVNFTGSKYVSGVEYFTFGNVVYKGTASNVYRNVYSLASDAISFPNRVNLNAIPATISVVGSGIVNGSSQALPNLDTNVSNPELTDITITATLTINNLRVLGDKLSTNAPVGIPNGELASNINIKHPFPDKVFNGSSVNEKGMLLYNIIQASNNKNENFEGEVDRMIDRDYTTSSYSLVDSVNYNWLSNQSLIGSSAGHNTGLLVFNGGLYYPDSNLLNTEYSIVNGNFNALKYSPASNVNYQNAASIGSSAPIRKYYRRFKSKNGSDLATLKFKITHAGSGTDFLSAVGAGGSPINNQIKFDFIIKRQNNTFLPYANPFSTDGLAQGGIQNQGGFSDSTRNSLGLLTTTVEANLTTNRVGFNDIVIVRVRVSDGYLKKITNIEITNL